MESWRLIIEGKNSASYNMAVDDYLLDTAETSGSAPIIRIYGWDLPSITIGYHQELERAVDISKLNGTGVVRRVTGGRALYHDDGELTYAVAGNFIEYPQLGGDLHRSYHLISQAIVLFYRNIFGWPADISHRDEAVNLGGASSLQKGCFSAVSRHEIIVSGQKRAAGSQRRTKCALMQHGAIKTGIPSIHPAIVEMPQGDGAPGEYGAVFDRQKLERGLVDAFERTFKMRLESRSFSIGEIEAINGRQGAFKKLC